MSALTRALLADLDHEDLNELAERLAPYLPAPPAPAEDRWLNTREAAQYIGKSPNALHKLTAARSIPFDRRGREANAGSSGATSTSGGRDKS